MNMSNQYPAFPDDVPTADIQCLSFVKLLSNDALESEKLFEACKSWGFFHLSLDGCPQGETLLKAAEEMFEFNRQVHEIKDEEKMAFAYSPPRQLFG